MGIGPVYAIPKVLSLTGLRQEDVDLFEVSLKSSLGVSVLMLLQINEAFSSMYVYCVDTLGLDREKVK